MESTFHGMESPLEGRCAPTDSELQAAKLTSDIPL